MEDTFSNESLGKLILIIHNDELRWVEYYYECGAVIMRGNQPHNLNTILATITSTTKHEQTI